MSKKPAEPKIDDWDDESDEEPGDQIVGIMKKIHTRVYVFFADGGQVESAYDQTIHVPKSDLTEDYRDD